MGRPRGWMVTLTGRPAMRSPGRPPVRRDVERGFWMKIAEGLSSEEAAIACGVSGPVGVRWFRERGGMPSIQLTPLSGRYLSFAEREDIALLRGQGLAVRAIARTLGRFPSTISRQLRRNAATGGGQLVACLRTGRALRVPRARTKGRGKPFVTPEIMITERPADVAERAVPGHWEGDLIIGLNKSAIGTLVERTTRFTMLLHLPPMEGHGEQPRGKNGPPLAGHGAEAVRDEIARVIETLPEQLRRSLTWDQGTEMAQHAQLRVDTGLAIYFCDPHSPWQRGTNENTNGLLRQYFPKGTDLHRHRREDIDAVALALNTRPRKTLGWRTPAEALDEHLRSIQKSSVATTG